MAVISRDQRSYGLLTVIPIAVKLIAVIPIAVKPIGFKAELLSSLQSIIEFFCSLCWGEASGYGDD